jgi:predicted nuclease of restriction endonuclease-like (RecB) superfamily
MNEIIEYGNLLKEIKDRIRQAQIKAVLSVNAEMINLYWDIGKLVHTKQKLEAWGTKVIQRLSIDIHNELPEIKGFSHRNIKFMIQLYTEYELNMTFGKQLVSQIPWGHNILLMQRIKDHSIRFWHIEQIVQNGWSRDTLNLMIKSDAYNRQGGLVNNFQTTLQKQQSDLVLQTMKDPYIFDFLTLTETFQERELETELIFHLEKFLLNWELVLLSLVGNIIWK